MGVGEKFRWREQVAGHLPEAVAPRGDKLHRRYRANLGHEGRAASCMWPSPPQRQGTGSLAGRGPLTCRHLGRDDFLYWRTGVGESAETLQESQYQCRKGGAGRGELGQGSASGDLIAAQVRMAPDDVR